DPAVAASHKDSSVTVASTPDVPEQPTGNFNSDNYYNNITAVLSGLKGKAHNLNYLFDTVAWATQHKFVDSSWARLEKKRLKAMRDWAAKEFAAPNEKAKTVFYPFSGPDFLTATTFFPNADTYIMLGLEPVGKLPELKKFKPGQHSEYAYDFKKSLGDIFDKSYFITRKMLQDFQSQKVNGLLPVLTFFIRKTGHEIADIKYLVRYNQDSISEVSYDFKDPERKPFGVRVDFMQDGKRKSVYYFKYDVSDKKFNDTCVFYKYLNKYNGYITYIKSASYLLHNNFMSNMRKMILQNSLSVVQDDTGLPYKYFQEGNAWTIKLYGEYARPVSDFPYLSMQKPLEEAFHKDSLHVGKLPFHLGYHWGSKKDVIIYALKK
ncbi:MAG: hypothetical protein ACXVP0_06240, partial [Bacteroidia bacterium]